MDHDHPPLHPASSTMSGGVAAQCIREVLTLRLPRCERGALPLSYGCPSARPVSNEAFRCIRAASSPADSEPLPYLWSWVVSIHRHRVFEKNTRSPG